MSLFELGPVQLHSGSESDFKINCDALTDNDWACLAHLIAQRVQFRQVYGVPTGGVKLAGMLQAYCQNESFLPVLICDDVLTTGNSMYTLRRQLIKELGHNNFTGAVVFSRSIPPMWISTLFRYFDQ